MWWAGPCTSRTTPASTASDEEHILHAVDHPIRVFDLDAGFTMVVGADTASRLLEVGVVEGDRGLVVVHAMPARRKFLR